MTATTSSQLQDTPVQQPLAELHQNNHPTPIPAHDPSHPFYLSATLYSDSGHDTEADENVPPPGPSRVVYPLPGVRASDIRNHAHDAFHELFKRPTTMTARAVKFALFEDTFDVYQAAPPPPSPVDSPGDPSRTFGKYNGPLSDIPLRQFVREADPKKWEVPDKDVDDFSLPPLLISPDLRDISEDD